MHFAPLSFASAHVFRTTLARQYEDYRKFSILEISACANLISFTSAHVFHTKLAHQHEDY